MRKRKNKKQPQKELPNIYGRKPSMLVIASTGASVNTYPSRRQARLARAKECEAMGLKTYETRIVPNGAQLSETEKQCPRKQVAAKLVNEIAGLPAL